MLQFWTLNCPDLHRHQAQKSKICPDFDRPLSQFSGILQEPMVEALPLEIITTSYFFGLPKKSYRPWPQQLQVTVDYLILHKVSDPI
jgi:hypothetical protein